MDPTAQRPSKQLGKANRSDIAPYRQTTPRTKHRRLDTLRIEADPTVELPQILHVNTQALNLRGTNFPRNCSACTLNPEPLPLLFAQTSAIQAVVCASTSKLPKIMDPRLPVLFLLGYWAMILGIWEVQARAKARADGVEGQRPAAPTSSLALVEAYYRIV